ncbi:unnamed protein product [Brachionus calyciflorus]|uniref:JmjC domain-containing protein n=1 Tax=Brachionus calyciflorus TaxID=104777 RepID=A0A814CJQ1_9BILA|nr:unnamed protein product [Brachionus calyciflorus]
MTFRKNLVSFLCLVLFFNLTECNQNINHPGHLKPFGSSGPFLQLEEVTSLPTKIFFENYVQPKQAVVMRNFVNQFPAFKSWKDEYLYSKASDNDDYKILVETQKKESRDQDTLKLSLTEFLDNYKSRSIYMVNEVPPYLKKDVLLPQPLQCGQAPTVLEETIMWFSSGGTSSVVHTDDYENILCVFDGTKELVLVDYFKHKRIADSIIDEYKGSYSSMDVDKVDYKLFPDIENLEYYRVNVSAGDCLYIPFKWIHQVRSYGRNLAINFWFNYEKIFGNTLFPEECSNNKLDLSKTLDKFTYSASKNDFYSNFKTFIMRQVNLGSRQLNDWISLILGEREFTIEEKQYIEDLLGEA